MFNIRKLFFNAARWFFATPTAKHVAAASHSLADAGKPYRIPYPRPSRSKYMPHQGKRERLRRVMGGFHDVSKSWQCSHDDAVARIIKHTRAGGVPHLAP